MGTPLKNPPVYFTLAQVRFNPVLKLADYLPSIQEAFRRADFPGFEQQQLVTIQVTLQNGQPTPSPVLQDRFQFGNVEKTHTFILDSQSLTLQSTNYGQFETFSECFLKGLNIVNDAVQFAFTDRVGLRYLDRVMPQDGETIEQYLADQVHGLNSRLGGKPLYSYSEALNEIGNIRLLSRVSIQDGALAFPPDLQPGNLVVSGRFTAFIGKCAVFDNDGFVEGREVFSADAVATHLDAIHKAISAAFKTTATSYAFEAWGK